MAVIINIPQLDRLKGQLLISGLQQRNQPLYQVIDQLIDAVRQGINQINASLTDINNTASNIQQLILINQIFESGGGGGGDDGLVVPGPIGPAGAAGSIGPLGPMGAIIFPDDAEPGDVYPPMPGPQGNAGPTGPGGPLGVSLFPYDGENGEDGLPGPAGTPGAQGISGSDQLRVITSNTTITADTTALASESIEIAGGIIFEIASGAIFEIVGAAEIDVGLIELSTEGVLTGVINLSTLGTIDWFVTNGVTTNPFRSATSSTLHSKTDGGWLMTSFDQVFTGTPTVFGSAPSGFTITTTVADDIAAANLSSAASNGLGFFTSTGAKYGFKVRVPASTIKRVLRLYFTSFWGNALITASLTNSSYPAKTYTIRPFSGNTIAYIAKVGFTANGGELEVSAIQQTTGLGAGSNPNIVFYWGYLANS